MTQKELELLMQESWTYDPDEPWALQRHLPRETASGGLRRIATVGEDVDDDPRGMFKARGELMAMAPALLRENDELKGTIRKLKMEISDLKKGRKK